MHFVEARRAECAVPACNLKPRAKTDAQAERGRCKAQQEQPPLELAGELAHVACESDQFGPQPSSIEGCRIALQLERGGPSRALQQRCASSTLRSSRVVVFD